MAHHSGRELSKTPGPVVSAPVVRFEGKNAAAARISRPVKTIRRVLPAVDVLGMFSGFRVAHSAGLSRRS